MVDEQFLARVPDDKAFGFENNVKAYCLEDLYNIVKNSDQGLFLGHVTSDRNDFANWIRYCILDVQLADKISSARERNVFLRMLEDEMDRIKGAREQQQSAEQVTDQQSQSQIVQTPQSQAPQVQDKQVQDQQIPVQTQQGAQSAQATALAGQLPDISVQVDLATDQRFDFEDVFASLIDDIEREIVAWE